MARVKPTTDPYRVLGILRGAGDPQIKAAHRRMAKRYHPDGATGDEQRFLAVQEAYQLLSDPLRRREWDRRHAPGPVRAAPRARTQTGADVRSKTGPTRRGARSRSARPRGGTTPRARTWSDDQVPWWQDFQKEDRPEQPGAAKTGPADQADESRNDFDVYSRSSGAAWSAAARQHFRRGTADLPSRGVWRYRGTQVVTGAEARKVAAEEEKENPPR